MCICGHLLNFSSPNLSSSTQWFLCSKASFPFPVITLNNNNVFVIQIFFMRIKWIYANALTHSIIYLSCSCLFNILKYIFWSLRTSFFYRIIISINSSCFNLICFFFIIHFHEIQNFYLQFVLDFLIQTLSWNSLNWSLMPGTSLPKQWLRFAIAWVWWLTPSWSLSKSTNVSACKKGLIKLVFR